MNMRADTAAPLICTGLGTGLESDTGVTNQLKNSFNYKFIAVTFFALAWDMMFCMYT